MKKFLYIFYLIAITNSVAQTASTFVPKVNNIPSSPEAALLGRFGDIPVGYYTGSANISIPLYSIQESGVEIPIVLSYNATGIRVADEATWVGLGWSLEPGGTLMQEVRGKEDNVDSFYWPNHLGATSAEWQVFKTTLGPIGSGVHYRALQNGQCLWEPTVAGQECNAGTDAAAILVELQQGSGQPDIYNYNFPGYSGKYFKNPETGEIVLLDKKTKLYISGNAITTPEGNVFLFNSTEVTHGSNFFTLSGVTNKLSSISFTNGKTINFTYADENYSTFLQRSTVVLNPYTVGTSTEPNTPQTFTDVTYGTKKRLTQIETADAYINFIAEAREDMVVNSANNLQRLKQIDIVSKVTGKKIKSFVFSYSYFNAGSDYHSKRLKLDSVKEVGYDATGTVADNSKPAYQFAYDTSVTLPAKESMAVDFWGYFNGQTANNTLIPDLRYFEYEHDTRYTTNGNVNFNYNYTGANRFPDNSKAKAYMLKKVVYPTGGYTEFQFEPHTFSNQYLPDITKLTAASKIRTANKTNIYTTYEDYFEIFTISKSTTLRFHNTFSHGSPMSGGALDTGIVGNIYNNSSITLTKTVGGTSTTIKSWLPSAFMTLEQFKTAGTISWDEDIWVPYEAGASYTLTVNFPTYTYSYANPSMAQAYSQFRYYDDTGIDTSASSHGGFRISIIKSYTDTGVLASHKQINYYEGKLLNLFEPLESMNMLYCYNSPGVNGAIGISRKRISLSSDDFGLNGGNAIGYGKVEEVELANGGADNIGRKTFYFINQVNAAQKGLPKSLNLTNGLMNKEEVYDKQQVKQLEKSYTYTNLSSFNSYYGIVLQQNHTGNNDYGNSVYTPPSPLDIEPVIHKFSYGVYPLISEWNMLQSITTKEFMSGTEIASTQTYTYNPDGHPRTTATTYATGEQTATTLYYPGEVSGGPGSEAQMVAAKMTGIPLYTEQYKNSALLSLQKSEYVSDATTSTFLMPKYIYSKKGNVSGATPERRVTLDKYDDKGNLLQYTLENGTPVCYVWGYNKTMPIAMIQNATYDSFNSTVNSWISSAQGYSNANNEGSLLIALDAIRTNLPNAMVTTYTFRPLVGVSTITDAKGDKITYAYDNFGRLISVKDKNGKLLSENFYNYRPVTQP